MLAIAGWMMKHIPGSFLPPEDQGYILGAVIMPDAAGLDRTGAVSRHVTDYFVKSPATEAVVVVDGYSLLDGQTKSNAAVFFVGLKDFAERYSSDNIRTQNARAVILDAYQAFLAGARGHHPARSIRRRFPGWARPAAWSCTSRARATRGARRSRRWCRSS